MMEILTSRKNATIQRVRKLLSSRKARVEEGLFVADGTKLLTEAIQWWPGLKTVLHTPDIDPEVPAYVEKICISRELMEYVSPMETPQGALFVCALPEEKPLAVKPGMVLLDGTRKSIEGHNVQALILKYGAKKLSEVDPAHYADLLHDAEVL